MSEKKGVKEIIEATRGATTLAAFCRAEFKDGVQLADGFTLMRKFADPQFRVELWDAIEGSGEIDDEIKDLDAEEAAEVLTELFKGLKKVTAA